MRTNRVVLIATVLVAVGILVAVLSSSGRRDIAGSYDVYVNGTRTGTVVTIESHGSRYLFRFAGSGDMEETFVAPKSRRNEYVLENRVAGKLTAYYDLVASSGGLKGSADVLPIGRLDVEFKRIK